MSTKSTIQRPSRRRQQLASCLESLVTQIQQEFPQVDATKAQQLVKEQVAAAKFPKRRNKPRAEIPSEERCKARVWGDGSGTTQCSLRICQDASPSHYCKAHFKKAEVTEIPLQMDESGKRVGLFMGRIDQPMPWKDEDGLI